MSSPGFVNIEIDAIATIHFEHPKSNSLPTKLLEELALAFGRLSNEKKVHAIVLQSGGDQAFCAGASFDELKAVSTPQEGSKFFSGFAHVLNAMRRCIKPIIGRVQGKAVGGGVGLIAACDYVFAVDCASVKLSELSIGIGPFVIAPAVERKIGTAAFTEISLNAFEWKSTEWAQQKCLFTEVFSSVEKLDERLISFTGQLITYPVNALETLSKVWWEGTDHWAELLEKRAAMSGALVLSDFAQGILKAK